MKKPSLFICLLCTLIFQSCKIDKIIGKKKTSKSTENSTNTGGGSGGGADGGGSGGGGGGSSTNPTVVTQSYGLLFSTTATTNGAFAWTGSYPGDITKGDDLCATEASSRGLSGTFKAVVGESSLRGTGNNWVLKKSAEYRRPDGTVIGNTDSSGAFIFPLTNAIENPGQQVWTGLSSTTAVISNAACSGWSDNSFMTNGRVGDTGASTSMAISKSTETCDSTYALLCAEMIKRTTTYNAQASYRRIFASTVAMDAASGAMGADGAARFDSQCQSDASTKGIDDGGHTTYKALVMTNTTSGVTRRVACLTANCGNGAGEAVGWILEASTQYRREDGTTIIGTTNANGIFDFPLTNSWTGVNEDYWTGFSETWATATNNSVGSCSFFQNKNNDGTSSFVGNGATTGIGAINTGTQAFCSAQKKILCVEQKRTQNIFVDYPGYN